MNYSNSQRPQVERWEVMVTLLSNLPGIVYRRHNNRNCTLEFISDGGFALTGYHPEALLSDQTISYMNIIHHDDRERVWNEIQLALRDKRPFQIEYRIITGSGQEKWVWEQGTGIPDDQGQYQALEGFIIDITDRKRIEKALLESEEKYRTLVENASDFIFMIDESYRVLSVNRAGARLWGKEPLELRGTKISDLFPAELAKHYLASLNQVFKTGETLHIERQMIVRDREFWITTSLNPVKDQSGRVWAALGSSRDITERKKAEERLQFLSSITEQVSDGVVVTDTDYRIIYVNKAALELFGYSADEIIGLKTDIFATDPGLVHKNIRETSSLGSVWSGSKLSRKKDGSTFINELKISPMRDISGRIVAYVGVQRDVTERVRTEREQQKISKLESVGTLAGGIAHDFNNLLTGIMGNIQLAASRIQAGKTETARDNLLESEKACLRAKDLTQQLLTFSKGGVPVKKVISISQLIRDSATFALRGSRSRADFSISDDLWAVEADEGQLNQVISNIVINAVQAMPQGGVINIGARNAVIGPEYALPLQQGKYVEILIEDHGTGIPEEHLGKIFDPYFTTKAKGVGLGLTTAFAIVKSHGGHIAVESESNAGAVFRICIPASMKRILNERQETSEKQLLRARYNILVMDDEEVIRDLLRDTLNNLGYDVVLTEEGAAAVEKYIEAKKSGKPFDAAILDLTVPGRMGGKEAVGKLLEIDSGAKVIVSSGYANDSIIANYKNYGFSAVLNKPYSIRDLQSTLHNMLSRNK